jgi:hypothetical protein
MTRTVGVAGFALAALLGLPNVPAQAGRCLETGKLEERLGGCVWGGPCAGAYADATPQIMDDTYVVQACAGGEDGVHACYFHARTSYCTGLK